MKLHSISFLILCIIINHYVGEVKSARILGVFSTPSISHQLFFQPLWKELSLRGHELVVLTPNPLEDPYLTTLTEINWKDSYVPMKRFTDILNEPKGFFDMLQLFKNLTTDIMDVQFTHPEVQKLLKNETEHFDLLIVEIVFHSTIAFMERFKCPTIGIMSLAADIITYDAIGNPSHPAYNPDMQVPYAPPLTLLQRIESTLASALMRFLSWYMIIPMEDSLVEKYFGEGYSSVYDMMRNLDLLFLNVNPIFQPIRPNVPAVIELGGLHINQKKPLPCDLESFLNDATDGAIYFSLGSNVKSAQLDSDKFNLIVEALSELPYKVLWKFETDDFPNKPSNIKIEKWFPQQDILGHKNIKLFITQGGLQSMEEAIYNEIPMLGIPFFGDQPSNVAQLVRKGLGLQIDFKSVTKDDFKHAVQEVITNPKYKLTMQKAHKLIIDKPMNSMENAIWWIEYVLRHKGAKHLRSPSIDIPLYQYLLLDVIAIFVAGLFLLYKILRICVHILIYFINIFKRKAKNTDKVKLQ